MDSSDLSPQQAAKEIADHYEGISTDNETTRVVEDMDSETGEPFLTVMLAYENIDGPDQELASVLAFTVENMRWALAQIDQEVPTILAEAKIA